MVPHDEKGEGHSLALRLLPVIVDTGCHHISHTSHKRPRQHSGLRRGPRHHSCLWQLAGQPRALLPEPAKRPESFPNVSFPEADQL